MTRTIRETYQKNHDESRWLIDTLGHLQHEVRRNSRLSPILACSFATNFLSIPTKGKEPAGSYND